ncbi:hypothetical protein [Indioceanicola profundi]|uniref:hypothetical protein n=1 Tax=Indioceanicola profundi TaxID=2220096 RepID=UPI000E6ABCF4|nr:hypothetical protein [Indioceanicola profundi]
MDVLETAKAEAQNSRAPVLMEWQGEDMHVAESGAKGGYAYRCDTGHTGATWFFSRNQIGTNWNIRVSTKSNALAAMGLGGVRAEMHRFLEAIGAEVRDAAISRVDYCLDFLAEDMEAATGEPFRLDPHAFVMHSHTSRADHMADADKQLHGVSGRCTSVTCGKLPGRQIIVYEKSREIRAKQKPEWWSHWNIARTRQGLSPLTGKERVWRVELRAGKDHLKERWGIRTWADLDDKLGDMFNRALDNIRYTEPNPTDTERFRWPNHPLWNAVTDTIRYDLAEMTTGAEPGVVKDVKRTHLRQRMEAQIKGLVATYSITHSIHPDAGELATKAASLVRNYIKTESAKFATSRAKSERKYRFIGRRPDEL